MATTRCVVAPKGGQGATTVAATLALYAAEDGTQRVLLVSDDDAPVLGIPDHRLGPWQLTALVGEPARRLDAATSTPPGWDGDLRIIDGPAPGADTTVMVIRNRYLALRRALAGEVARADCVVLIREPGHAIEPRDVAGALGLPVTTIPADPAVARRVDAGLLAEHGRLPRSLQPLRSLSLGGCSPGIADAGDPGAAVRGALQRIDRPDPVKAEGLGR
jgi:hypothetical protein